MTVEERIGHVRFERALMPRLGDALVARFVPAFGVDIGSECDPLSVRRPDRIGHARRNVGQPLRFATVEGK
jgi:hypothetical protein